MIAARVGLGRESWILEIAGPPHWRGFWACISDPARTIRAFANADGEELAVARAVLQLADEDRDTVNAVEFLHAEYLRRRGA
jgi:hypothetical protein